MTAIAILAGNDANIIPLPTASAVPVVNIRRRGPFPRGVLSLARHLRERNYQQFLHTEQERKITEASRNKDAELLSDMAELLPEDAEVWRAQIHAAAVKSRRERGEP